MDRWLFEAHGESSRALRHVIVEDCCDAPKHVHIQKSTPYLVTLAEGLAGVKAEVAPRVKRKAKRDRRGAMVKVCDASCGQVYLIAAQKAWFPKSKSKDRRFNGSV